MTSPREAVHSTGETQSSRPAETARQSGVGFCSSRWRRQSAAPLLSEALLSSAGARRPAALHGPAAADGPSQSGPRTRLYLIHLTRSESILLPAPVSPVYLRGLRARVHTTVVLLQQN